MLCNIFHFKFLTILDFVINMKCEISLERVRCFKQEINLKNP